MADLEPQVQTNNDPQKPRSPQGALASGVSDLAKNTSPLLLLHDMDIRRALLDFNGQVYHYKQNTLGRGFVLVMALLLAIAAVAVGVVSGFSSVWWIGATTLLGIGSLASLMYVAHWQKFALNHFIALDENHFYVGSNQRAWRVSWAMLDTHSSGLTRLDTTTSRSILPMRVAGQSIDVHLYHPLMHIDDLQGFMMELLSRMPQNRSEEE